MEYVLIVIYKDYEPIVEHDNDLIRLTKRKEFLEQSDEGEIESINLYRIIEVLE